MKRQTVSPEMTRAIEEAAQWYACLASQQADERDRQGLLHWLDEDPVHQQAWARVQQVRQRFEQVPGAVAATVLQRPAPRRAVLRSVFGLIMAGVAFSAYRYTPWREWQADERTSVGSRRSFVLGDGSRLTLNTQSAVDVLFDGWQRQVALIAGEILVETHVDSVQPARPFLVQTPNGSVQALGTRFIVRQMPNGESQVHVLDKAVEVRPVMAPQTVQRLEAGQGLVFGKHQLGALQSVPVDADAWTRARLSVLDMPLAQFVQELSRYRSGYLGYAPELAALRVSGVFPLDDTDEALDVLADGFPVKIERVTRYWARVVPR